MARAITCPACGAKQRASRDTCLHCGAPVADASVRAWHAALHPNRLMMVGATVLFAGVIGAVLWPRGSRGAAPVATAAPAPATAGAVARGPEPPSTTVGGVAVPFLEDRRAGGIAYASGNYDEALAHYRAALKYNPEDAETLSNMGQVLVRVGRTEEAVPLFKRAIALIPNRWAYHFNLAHGHGLLGDWEGAVAEYEVASRLFPNDYVTQFNLGLALHKLGNEAAAVEAYQRAIELEPKDPSFHMALGNSLEKLQRTAAAAAAYIRALELAPDAPDAEKVRARILQLANASQTSASTVSR